MATQLKKENNNNNNSNSNTNSNKNAMKAQTVYDDSEVVSSILNMNLGELDITSTEIDLNVEDDISALHSDAIIKEALDKGEDLRHYSRQIEQELQINEGECIQDYERDADNLAELHNQIKTCDSILETMQNMLSQFQGDLGAISSEIASLQDKSSSMKVKLANRKAAESMLSRFIDQVYISEELSTTIMDGAIDDEFMEATTILDSKIAHLTKPGIQSSLAAADMIPVMERLRAKCLSRIREFLLDKFYAMRRPKTTGTPAHQQSLLRYGSLYQFLYRHSTHRIPERDVSLDVRNRYVETMSPLYETKLKKYLSEIRKLVSESTVSKTDLLAVEESKTGGLFSTVKKSVAQLNAVFALGNRDALLTESEREAFVPHVAEKMGQKLPIERLFKSAQWLLMESAMAEFDFIKDFFIEREREEKEQSTTTGSPISKSSSSSSTSSSSSSTTSSSSSSSDNGYDRANNSNDMTLFKSVFGKSVNLFIEFVNEYLTNCNDALSVLVVIRIVNQNNLTMQHRGIHCLDYYFDKLNMMLWPKFKQIFDLNVSSVMAYPHVEHRRGSSFRPHFIGTRYGDYASAILKLNLSYRDDVLVSSLRRLRLEVEKLYTRSASRIAKPKEQIVFLINQYNAIQRILLAQGPPSEDSGYFGELVKSQISLYVEEELGERFAKLITFVKSSDDIHTDSSSPPSSASPSSVSIDYNAVDAINKLFSRGFRESIDVINSSVRANFAPTSTQSASATNTSTAPNTPTSTNSSSTATSSNTSNNSNNNNSNNNNNNNSGSDDNGAIGFSAALGDDSDGDLGTGILKQVLIQLLLYYQRYHNIVNRHCKTKPQLIKELIPIQTIMYEIRKYSKQQ